MQDPLPIQPFTQPVRGSIRPPGSKSLTNRALVLAALCPHTVRLTGALFSRDTRIMIAALQALGLAVQADEAAATIEVVGKGGQLPQGQARLQVGNAGTAARFLTALLATRREGRYELDGDEAMRERPMEGLCEALAAQGARFTFTGRPGHFPFVLEPAGLAGGLIEVDAAASSQMLSALLQVAPLALRAATVRLRGETVSEPFVQMTVDLLAQFGVPVEVQGKDYVFSAEHRPHLAGGTYDVEPDATAASYFLALPLAVALGGAPGGVLEVEGLRRDMLQGDIAFADVLARAGQRIQATDTGFQSRFVQGPTGPLEVDFEAISDTFLTLAAVAPLLPGPIRITGIGHTRHQETDRLAAAATELRRLGQRVDEEPEALTIHPDPEALRQVARQGVTIHTYEDHRVAMSFAILGCADWRGDGQPWLRIADPACCGKTYPRFFEVLQGLHAAAHAQP